MLYCYKLKKNISIDLCVYCVCVCKCIYWNNCVPLWLSPTSFPLFECNFLLSTRNVLVSYFWREMTVVTELSWGELTVAVEVSWQELTVMAERSALFLVNTQRVVVIPYRPMGTIYLSCLQGTRFPLPKSR